MTLKEATPHILKACDTYWLFIDCEWGTAGKFIFHKAAGQLEAFNLVFGKAGVKAVLTHGKKQIPIENR